MARRKFYMSRDDGNWEKSVSIWHGRPRWDKKTKFFRGFPTADEIVNFDISECLGKTIWLLIKPYDLKPGECKEIKVPKLEFVEK